MSSKTQKKIYISETGWRLADRFRAHLQEKLQKTMTQMRPNQLGPVVTFLVTPTTTSQFPGFLYTTGTQKGAKISNKNLLIGCALSAPDQRTPLIRLISSQSHAVPCHHIATDGKAPPYPHINQQHPAKFSSSFFLISYRVLAHYRKWLSARRD